MTGLLVAAGVLLLATPLGIWRTPTTLVLDPEGRIVRRAAGVPRKPQVVAAVAELLPAP